MFRRLVLSMAILTWIAEPRPLYADVPNERESVLAGPVNRETLVRLAVERSPMVRAANFRARGARYASEAEGRLPPPEVMAQVWQVPVTRPYAIGDAQMIMAGVSQKFPAPGSRGAREEAQVLASRAEEAGARMRAIDVTREMNHAFADYVEATSFHKVHLEHRTIARRVLDVARGRHEAGGSLANVAQAELELARMQADVAADARRVVGARVRINALLQRATDAPLGSPVVDEPSQPEWSAKKMIEQGSASRPEVAAAKAVREREQAELKAVERESTWPEFSVGALYFAPTNGSTTHGYGVNATMSLPWLWGAADKRAEGRREMVKAADAEVAASSVPIEAQIAGSLASVQANAHRLQWLRDRALPASRKGFDLAWGAYESNRGDAFGLLNAHRAIVDTENEMIAARAALDHALAELDAAVGVTVPRKAVGGLGQTDGEEARDER